MTQSHEPEALATGANGRVGVRELRQYLSTYLERVATGETFIVNDRGHPVALLTPLPAASTLVETLAAAGRVRRARTRLADVPRLQGRLPPSLTTRLRKALEEVRQDTI